MLRYVFSNQTNNAHIGGLWLIWPQLVRSLQCNAIYYICQKFGLAITLFLIVQFLMYSCNAIFLGHIHLPRYSSTPCTLLSQNTISNIRSTLYNYHAVLTSSHSLQIIWLKLWPKEWQIVSELYEYIFELWKKYFVVDGKASKIPDAMMLVDIW